MKNKIAFKLTLYFSAVLLLFAMVVGGIFYGFFQQHTVDIKREEMERRAEKIAAVIQDNMQFLGERYGANLAQSRFINYIDNITPEIVSLVDGQRNLSMNMEAIKRHRERMVREGHGHKMRPLPADAQEAYSRLPQRLKDRVEACFRGQSFAIDEYSQVLGSTMLTVGHPVYDQNGTVRAVVLIHSPVQGMEDAVMAGLRILGLAVLGALVLGLVLSVIFSWRFTKPLKKMQQFAQKLANRDYSSRNNIQQQDEIGDLASTLDILAQRLQLADQESQRLEQLRRQFIANISHELRTPVTVIRGSLEAMRDGIITEPEEIAEFQEQMYKESRFLERLINDLLDLSRLQNVDFPIEKEQLNLCEIVHDAARAGRRLAQEKNIELVQELDCDSYVLQGDYGRLRQMLLIFIHNSIKFSPNDSTVLLKLQGKQLIVEDQGCGMAPEELEHAFERFYRSRDEQNKTGSGLGLAIAWQIAQRHSLQLRLESQQGQGTRVIIDLP